MSQQHGHGQVRVLNAEPDHYYLTTAGRFTLASAYCFLACLFTAIEGATIVLLVAFARALWGIR